MILSLNFYGVTCRVSCPDDLGAMLRRDFAYFAEAGAADDRPSSITLSFRREAPLSGKRPCAFPSLYHGDWTAYDRGHLRYVDYRKKALGVYDYFRENGELYSEDANLLHELAYLMILSRAGELLDKKGLHRVHAMGVTVDGRGVMCLMPQGGGKTTLCLELLKSEGVRLVSDDTPLVNASGEMLPFPSRIGVCAGDGTGVPAEYLSEFRRRRYGPKVLIDTEYFRGRIETAAARPAVILVGERGAAERARFEKMRGAGAIAAFVKNCVIGVGLPQVMEYFVRLSPADAASKAAIALSRFRASRETLRRAAVYRFVLGPDTRTNAETLLSLLRRSRRSLAA